MEDYNEKLNYGSNDEPLYRDRLQISCGLYGFNIFDRKLKVRLLSEKSKEDCEEGKKLLLDGDNEGFENLKNSSKEVEIPLKVILFNYDDYEDYYSIPTITDLYKLALYHLKKVFESKRYFELMPLPKPLDYTEKDIESLPESFRKEAEKNLKYYNDMVNFVNKNNSQYKNVEYAINNERGDIAWNILQSCDFFEFEFINILKL